MRRGSVYVAAAGAVGLAASLWLPWFTRRVSQLIAPLASDRSISGWSALGKTGFVLLAATAVVAAWAFGRLPAFGLVVAGALALLVEVGITAQRLDTADQDLITTSPAIGLLLAVAGATAILLVGMAALLSDARRRAEGARAG